MRVKKASTSSGPRAAPLPRGTACLQCRSRRVKCDSGFPCSACKRNARFHGFDEQQCREACVYSATSTPAAPRRGRKRSPDELPTKIPTEETLVFSTQDDEKLGELESHMLEMERKIQVNLKIARDSSLPLSPLPYEPRDHFNSTPSPTTPPLSHSPQGSTLSYASPDIPLFYPTLSEPLYTYPPNIYYPSSPPEPQVFQPKDEDVSQWAFDVAPHFSQSIPYDYSMCVAPLDTGGTVGVQNWDSTDGAWQRGLGLYDETGAGWAHWSV